MCEQLPVTNEILFHNATDNNPNLRDYDIICQIKLRLYKKLTQLNRDGHIPNATPQIMEVTL